LKIPTIRNAVVQAQRALAAYTEPDGPDAKTTISEVWKFLDSSELLWALDETAE
jgi:hypothetical protein